MKQVIISLFLCFLSLTFFSQNLNYYFGNLHSHTAFSDGNKDSVSSGVHAPDASYAYAKLSKDFDFLGISEHNHYNAARNPGFKLPRYQQGLNMANNANQDNVFLSLFGMEFGVASKGHVVLYGFNQLIGWETGVGGATGNNYDVFNDKSDYLGLFKKVNKNPGSFAYLAHPWWTDFSIDGTDSASIAFGPYNSTFDSAIVGMPLRSGNAFSTFTDYSDYPDDDYFDYYKKLLYNGYHLGIGYDHDNHNTNFGRGNGGRLVILAPALNRQELIKAMQNMHFYGSDDANAKVDFKLNGSIMGSVIAGTTSAVISVTHNDADGEIADTIRIWRGNKNSGGLWAQVVKTTVNNNTCSFSDVNLVDGIEYYYFVEIRQKDRDWIVTSPVWYNAGMVAGLSKNSSYFTCTVFPNPLIDFLHISFNGSPPRHISIHNLLGEKVFEAHTIDAELQLDLRQLPSGQYTMKVSESGSVCIKKINVINGE